MATSASVIASATDRLGNALRLYAETSIAGRALFAIDQTEAIDNLDRALDGILNGFHSLFDAMKSAKSSLDWYAFGDTAACLLVRNARHHNACGLFESWNSRMLKHDGLRELAGASFLLVGYELVAGEGNVSEYYVPLEDFQRLLATPSPFLRDPEKISAILDRDCAFGAIRVRGDRDRYPSGHVYVNLIPIVMNAATRVFANLKAEGVTLRGFDSTTYADHFAPGAMANLAAPNFKTIRAPLSP